MNAATEFDVGPLTWVKSEIDLALERAAQALQQYAASAAAAADGAGDLTQIRFARTHLHQVQGALTIVGLDGVTQFAEALEFLLEDAEQQKLPADAALLALVHRALETTRHYLDDLVGGQPNQPLRLLPLYREVQSARGQARVSATDLFFPDLSARPPRRPANLQAMAHDDFLKMLRQERARFQRGLLAWLRAPQERDGVDQMLDAVKLIEATQEAAAARSFWWVATGFLSALAEGKLPAETDVKQLCARIDLQIRRLAEGSRNVAERLMRDALYFVANADSDSAAVQQVKSAYRLQEAIPSAEPLIPAPQESARRRLREIIAATEEAWNRFCAGSAQALPQFRENAGALSHAVELLGHTDYRRLAQAVAAAANWLADQPARQSEALAMEVATAILLAQNAQENFQHLGGDFAHQVDVMVARIHGCIAENPPLPGSEVPSLDEMSRQAQEKLLIGQVAREIQSNLGQIEQVLDGFFRDAERRSDLAGLDVPIRQVIGALTVMRHDGAVDALRECAAEIKQFAAPDYQPAEADFERVADRLSLLGFFIDSLPHGTTDFAAFARQMRGDPADDAAAAEEEEATTSVEQEVEQQKREAQALLSALREQPSDAGLREELRQNLTALQKDADLVADKALGQQAKAMLTALNAEDAAAAPSDLGFADLMPQAAVTPQPSAETLQLSQSSSEEIDAELLSIFLEEAHEVLGAIAENLQVLHRQPHDGEVLTNIRRAFHTLKGSGRMVGLRDLGEAAWAIEQTLNQWLRQELAVDAPLLGLLDQALTVFTQWVAHLEQGGALPDASAMTALAERLRNGEETAASPAPEAPVAARGAEIIALEFPASPAAAGAEGGAGFAAPGTRDEAPGADETIERPDPDAFPELDVAAEPDASADAAPLSAPAANAASAFAALETIGAGELADLESAPADADAEFSFDLPAPDETPAAAESPARVAEAVQPRISVSPTLYEIFLEEARVHLATLQREFAVIETELHTPTPHEMYRAAHTLGGIAGTVGLAPINRLGLALEHALLRRDHAAQPGSVEAREVIRQTIAQIELMLAAVTEKREPEGAPHLIDALDGLFPAPAVDAGESARRRTAPAAPASAAVPATAGAFTIAPPQLQDELDEQLLPIFLEEAVDLGREITAQLRAWRDAPADDAAPRTLARLLHTLKGSARMAGAMNLGEITHAIESRVGLVQAAGAAPEQIEEIDNAFDAVAQIIDRLENGEALDAVPVAPAAAPASPTPPTDADARNVQNALDRPPPPVAEERRHGDRLHGEIEGEGTAQRAMLRVRAELIDRLVNEAGELSIARARIEGEMRGLKESLLDLTENVIRLRRQLRDIEIQAELQMQSRTAQADEGHAGFDPLEFDRFTRFQELTRMMAESVNDVATVQQNLLKNLDDAIAAIVAQARLNREVQQELMSVRMVPFGSVADRLYRVVRQTAKELGKRANLDIRGGQLELDRSVLEKIAAPLEHLLRNAVAHGLEAREVRQARNKPEIGEIALQLEQEGNEIILNFTDDGGGLDLERIRARGVEAGLLSAEEAEAADANRLSELIFTPGFSTAREISQVAGRGVGMDVVKTEVAALGGRVEVLTNAGRGTTFRLYIPLTLAVTKALLVRTGNRRYAIPSVMIEQVLDLKEAALTRIRETGAAEWMGNRYPFHFLPHLLGDAQALPEMHRQYWILLLRSGAQRIAVLVDELKGNQEIVVKNIGPQLARVIGIDGATVLGDGQVVLILNPVALASQPRAQVAAAPVPTALAAPAGQSGGAALPTVMVVDDSMTVRKITGRLLDREGYQVMLAKDGVDALEQMLETVPDVLLVDIEMPRMDGFDFTRNVRADARLKDIPIVMVTSRTADKHRNYAFEIGVNQYLGKPYQEDELLGFVAGYLKQRRPA